MKVFDDGAHQGGAFMAACISEGLMFLWGRLYLHANNVEINLACLFLGYFSYLAYLAIRRGRPVSSQ